MKGSYKTWRGLLCCPWQALSDLNIVIKSCYAPLPQEQHHSHPEAQRKQIEAPTHSALLQPSLSPCLSEDPMMQTRVHSHPALLQPSLYPFFSKDILMRTRVHPHPDLLQPSLSPCISEDPLM